MAATNIERFDEVVGVVFADLYTSFPIGYDLDPIAYPALFASDEEHAGWVNRDDGEFFQATVLWLGSAGYIDHGSPINSGTVLNCVLTAKGLEVLKATPESLLNGPSLGESLVSATKAGTKDLARNVVGQALSIGARMLTNHLGLPS